ncbi:M24 family metallopeptidase [Tundrisphaera lichenicola]|uniref:M24 family metallopeptidase n=1 Tax=Tundrisphaera lichenicola TaxID=2029860 RepID=UPI003EBCD357
MDQSNRRLEKLRKSIRGDRIDLLMVASETNVRYLSGFTGEASVLLVGKDRTLLVSDGRFTTQIEQECPGLEVHIRPVGQLLYDGLGEILAKLGVRRVGFEPSSLSVAHFETLKQKAPTVEWTGVTGRVESLRAIKDRSEIESIREAVRQAERGFAMLRASLDEDDSEKETADALEGYLRRCGASAASFPPIVAVGPRAALPHARPTRSAKVRDADFVLIDWGATSSAGYKSDLTRVLVTGKVTPKFEKVYRTVLAAQERGIAALRPGVKAGEVDAAARSVIEEAGFGRLFTHGLGHGVGLEIHENPFFRRDNQATLRAGMVVTIEPGIYSPEWGGVRIEDDILITPDGPEVLSDVPKAFESTLLR